MYLALIPDLLLLAATIGLAVFCRGLMRQQAGSSELHDRLDDLALELGRLRDLPEDEPAQGHIDTSRIEAILASADDRIGRLEMLLDSLEDMETDVAPATVIEDAPGFRTNRRIAGEFG